jgi:small subunit ribosomal protein S17
MTENEQNLNDEQTPETADEEAAEQAPAQAGAGEDAPAEAPTAEESAAEEAPAEAPAAEEPAAEEAPAEEPAAEEPAADEPAAGAAPAEAPEPTESLSPKERRKLARSTHTGETRAQRSIEERAQERAERRRQKAQRRRVYRRRVRERRAAEGPRTDSPTPEPKAAGIRKVRQGVVVSDKADKTITVRIDVVHQHRMYKKIVRASSTLNAHDENNEAHVGDTVRVVESRPLSRTKRWRLTEILERAR